MKIKAILYVHLTKYPWEETTRYTIANSKLDDDQYRTFMCEQETELEIPDNFDPREAQIAALRKMQAKAAADYQKTVMEINDQISKLQAIEYTA